MANRHHPPTSKPELAINRGDATVAGALADFITEAATGWIGGAGVDIATAYFNLGGYALLADSLDQVKRCRLLLGAEPAPREKRRALGDESVFPERARRERLQKALESHHQDLAEARDLLGFTIEADRSARRLVEWLRSADVEVRRLEDRFLHGKAFLIGDRHHGVVAGSSNFTHAGLTTNIELNLGNYNPHTVTQVQEWYDELWESATDYDLAGLFAARFEPYSPQTIYLRMLWERYGDELEKEHAEEPTIHLTDFQRDGLWRAKRILADHHGVLIADEVGLGKTYLAGELIRQAALERRQRVLVVAPATLRDGPWRAFRDEHLLHFEIVSFQDLTAESRLNPHHRGNGRTKLAFKPNDYALVVVDEAHNLRNPSTQRAEALRRLLGGSPRKNLVLLTATPVNNNLWDLYYQLNYFLRNDGVFADVGIKSLRDHFAHAMSIAPDDLTPELLFDVLDAVAVRRTRSFVKRSYSNDRLRLGGKEVQITFPTPRVRKVTYDLEGTLPGFFPKLQKALDPEDRRLTNREGVFTLARYAPSLYRLDEAPEVYELQLAGLLRSGLLKRFESSPHAFARTCDKMARSHDQFLGLLELGRVATGDALADWIATDSDDLDEVDHYLDRSQQTTDPAKAYDRKSLAADVRSDRDLLLAFAAEARTVTRQSDPNLTALVAELAAIAAEAEVTGIGAEDVRNRRKVLIFSYFSDTVDWIFEHLQEMTNTDHRLAGYRSRVAWLSGNGGSESRRNVLWGFAPVTTQAPQGADRDRYDIVVTTDVLAEGVNLQQAKHIINYDLPWNPMRLVQRHGRIDRIGSLHSEVFIHCVFPDAQLDELLGLEERLRRKITQAAATVGVDQILPGQKRVDREFTETREEIERLRREEADLFEQGGTSRSVLSGEEYRQELRRELEQAGKSAEFLKIPWGSGSGMKVSNLRQGRRGYVFCVRVADHDRALFCYVELNADKRGEETHEPKGDTLTCLDLSRPVDGYDTARALDARTRRLAFEAWIVGWQYLLDRWNFHADKANIEPKIRPLLKRAAELVRSNPPPDFDQSQVDKAIDSIQAPHTERTVRTIRRAMRRASDPADQAQDILTVVHSLGIEPYKPPQPLPEIRADDIHLVCWMALSP